MGQSGAPRRDCAGHVLDSCYASVAEENSARRILPIELSSVVSSLITLTRELTKKLSREELIEVIADLRERLSALPDERRGPDRAFAR
jgi:hypothetical protein